MTVNNKATFAYGKKREKEVEVESNIASDSRPRNERRNQPLCSCIRTSLDFYFKDLDGEAPGNLYDLVIGEIEKPLFEAVLERTRGNQTRAAQLLGINRSTLRKKLEHYGLR